MSSMLVIRSFVWFYILFKSCCIIAFLTRTFSNRNLSSQIMVTVKNYETKNGAKNVLYEDKYVKVSYFK